MHVHVGDDEVTAILIVVQRCVNAVTSILYIYSIVGVNTFHNSLRCIATN